MHLSLRLIAGLLQITSAAPAQSPSGTAPTAVVLIGVADHVNPLDHQPRQILITYLLTASPTAARIAARTDGLVVPRRTGWWRVVITRHCDALPTDKDTCADSISVLPLTSPRAPVRHDASQGAGDPCRYDYQALTFVSPTLLGASEHIGASDACEPRGWEWQDSHWMLRYGNDTLVPYTDWGDAADSAFTRGLRAAVNVGSETTPSPPQDENCRADLDATTGWGVVRERIRWVPRVFQQAGNALCQLEGPVTWQLPDSLIGYAEPALDWGLITGAVPGAEYAFGAPRSDYVVVAVPDAFRLYTLRDGKPGAMLLELPRRKDQDQIVLLQWAGGSRAGDWARTVAGAR